MSKKQGTFTIECEKIKYSDTTTIHLVTTCYDGWDIYIYISSIGPESSRFLEDDSIKLQFGDMIVHTFSDFGIDHIENVNFYNFHYELTGSQIIWEKDKSALRLDYRQFA